MGCKLKGLLPFLLNHLDLFKQTTSITICFSAQNIKGLAIFGSKNINSFLKLNILVVLFPIL